MSRAGTFLIACLLLIAAGSVTTAAARPIGASARQTVVSADVNGRVVFDACGDTGCDLYTANPDGTVVRQITHDGGSFLPDWSPDGRRVTYTSVASGFAAIWIVNANGRHPRQLTPDDPNAANLWPRFAPDGRTIYYTNCFGSDCDGGISAIRPDGSGRRVVTPNSGDSYNIGTPSPDGRRLAFMRWHVGGIHMRVFVKRVDGPRPRPEIPVTPPALEGWAPDWSPDGSAVLFSSNLFANRPNGAIYRVSIAASGAPGAVRKLTHPPFPLEDWAAAYSPRGDRIVFDSDRLHPARDGANLFTMNSDGTALRRMRLPHRFDQLYVEWPRWGTAPLKPAATSAVLLARGSTAAARHGKALLCGSLRTSAILAAALPAKRLHC